MQVTEHIAGMLVMMAIAGYAFYRMMLCLESAKPGVAFVLGTVWVATVAGAMWFAWPRASDRDAAAPTHQ